MLPKKQRINRALFQEVLSKGARYHSPHLSLCVLWKATNTRQFAFVVSKKILRLAVTRNKVRRRGYAIVRGLKEEVSPSIVGAFFFKKGAERLLFVALKQEIRDLLRQARLL